MKKDNKAGVFVAMGVISATLIPFLYSIVKLLGKK